MQTIKLNLIPGGVLPVVNVSQYDVGRHFAIQIYEGAASYDLTGKSVQIRGTKPDGNGFAYDSTDGVISVSGSTVTVSTVQQMTAVGGDTTVELRITASGVVLGTLNFVLMVEPSALSDDTPISETDIPAIERDFQAALDEAEADALKAEGHAQGTQDGTPVGSGSPYYQNNAKYYKEQADTDATNAGNSATSAAADALKSEGYAVGKQNGTTVQSGSPYYQNNAQYFDTHASEQAYNASQSANSASGSATAANTDALKSEGFAVGEQNGTPVSSGSPYYHNNAEYYRDQAAQYAAGGLHFMASVAFANIPTTGMANGDMYNITDSFTTDSRFVEGAGVSVSAGSNIAWVDSVGKWDVLAPGGGSGSLSGLTDVTITSATSDQILKFDGSKWVNGADSLSKQSDVAMTTPSNGQALVYDGNTGKWKNGTVSTVGDLDDLSDVDITTPSSGQFLKYDGAKWVNGTGGGGASALDDLTDVDITTPTDGQVLTYDANSQKWVNAAGGGGSSYKKMTARFDLSDASPSTWGEYLEDATLMTVGSSAWDTFFGIYPCMLKNGVMQGKLDVSQNYTKYTDGTSADITSGSDGDVMIAFPRRGLKIWKDSGYLYISMTDNPNDPNYDYYAHTYKGSDCDMFYLGRYKGYYDGSKLRSLSGKTVTVSQTIDAFRTYARNNGTGYEQSAFFQLIYRQAMYMLKYLGQNAQSAIGMGYVQASANASTGGTNAHPMDYGTSASNVQCSLFGIEDFWGNVYEFLDGLYSDASRQIYVSDGDYVTVGTGYTLADAPTIASNLSGLMKDVSGTSMTGFIPIAVNGSSSTYFCDGAAIEASCFAMYGGYRGDTTDAGVFRNFIGRDSASYTSAAVGARLMYMRVS